MFGKCVGIMKDAFLMVSQYTVALSLLCNFI